MKEWRAAEYDDFQKHHQLLYGQELLSRLSSMADTDGMSVLDLGCGSGDLTIQLSEMVGPSGKVTAIDRDAGMLAHFRTKAATRNVDVHEADLVAWLKSSSRQFDAIFSNATLHWLPSHVQFDVVLQESRRCLFNGGYIALQFSLTGNCEAAKRFLEARLRAYLSDPYLTLSRSPLDFSSCLASVQANGFDVQYANERTHNPFADKRMSFRWMMDSQPLLKYMRQSEVYTFGENLWQAWEKEQVEVNSRYGLFIARKPNRL